MKRLRLIHWNALEAEAKSGKLKHLGYDVAWDPLDQAGLRLLREDPPDVILIDLSRLPSQGRDVGLLLRKYKTTRHVPLVFVEGEPQKVEGIKELLPDALYTKWKRIRSALKGALSREPVDPVVPQSTLAAYAETPLPKKLGITSDSTVALVNAPEGFEEVLRELPKRVVLRRGARGKCDLILWFVSSRKDLERRLQRMGELAGSGGLWIMWPKRSSAVRTDLSQSVVRETGLRTGLVDYKVCSVDTTWSGLKFTRRKET